MDKTKYFYCVIGDTYKEFKINEESLDKLEDTLKKEIYHFNKFAPLYSNEEMNLNNGKKHLFNSILGNLRFKEVSLDSLFGEDVILNECVKELLEDIKMEEVFSLPVEKVPYYMRSLCHLAVRDNAFKKDVDKEAQHYELATTNSNVLSEHNITLEANDSIYSFKSRECLEYETPVEEIKPKELLKKIS